MSRAEIYIILFIYLQESVSLDSLWFYISLTSEEEVQISIITHERPYKKFYAKILADYKAVKKENRRINDESDRTKMYNV